MKQKLNCILLIDDDEPTNFINEMIINKANCTEKVAVTESGKEALDYLTSVDRGENPYPDLIFLDINMPAMNGWEFLEHYNRLSKAQQGEIVIIMLSTSLNPDDKIRANQTPHVNDFMPKPLTVNVLNKIIEKHFTQANK